MDINKYDAIVVGSGFAGSIIASRLARELNKKVLIIDKRNHIAGNMYDCKDNNGILFQKYGPHVIHTNSDIVFKYLSEFTSPVQYKLKCGAIIDNQFMSTPFNFSCIDLVYEKDEALELKTLLLNEFKHEKVTIIDLMKAKNEKIVNFANFLFEKDFRLYAAKQWGRNPNEIDKSIIERVPICLNYCDTYFEDRYEFLPSEGYTEMFYNILNHPNIEIQLNFDALSIISFDNSKVLIDNIEKDVFFTGEIDKLFNYIYGKLQYRTLKFEYEYLNREDYQKVAIVALPQDANITRITEYTKLPYQKINGSTLIAKEYSDEYLADDGSGYDPFYPVLTNESMNIYNKYKCYSENITNLYLCGRLAEFKYYNMDQVILAAFKVFNDYKGYNY